MGVVVEDAERTLARTLEAPATCGFVRDNHTSWLAVVGVGLIGWRHLAVAAKEPACKVVAAADPFAAARLDVERCGVLFYSDYRSMLDEERLDGVIIAPSNNMHVTVGLDCVSAGLPILVEKRCSDTLAAGQRLLGAATAAGVSVAVGHHRRFDPAIESPARALLAKGAIGTLSAVQLLWALRRHDSYYGTSWRATRWRRAWPY
ncbi:MAG: putative dehydrogenase [Gammaproteobacteria bacterium]